MADTFAAKLCLRCICYWLQFNIAQYLNTELIRQRNTDKVLNHFHHAWPLTQCSHIYRDYIHQQPPIDRTVSHSHIHHAVHTTVNTLRLSFQIRQLYDKWDIVKPDKAHLFRDAIYHLWHHNSFFCIYRSWVHFIFAVVVWPIASCNTSVTSKSKWPG